MRTDRVGELMHEEGKDAVQSAAQKVYRCLQSLHFLHRFKMDELEELLASMRKRRVPAGAVIYEEGDDADAFFLVASGQLSVWQRAGFRTHRVAMIRAEQYFGDNSLIGEGRRASKVIAESACELFVLYRQDFNRILMHNKEIASSIMAHRAMTLGHKEP